jgi:hypothetical protein
MSASGVPQPAPAAAERAARHELSVYAGTYVEGALCVALGCACGWQRRYPDGIPFEDLKIAAWADYADR